MDFLFVPSPVCVRSLCIALVIRMGGLWINIISVIIISIIIIIIIICVHWLVGSVSADDDDADNVRGHKPDDLEYLAWASGELYLFK